jgi:hypothetical protein
VLVHEAQANHLIAAIGDAAEAAGRGRVAKIMHDIPSYHTTPVEAAEAANAARVRLLVFSHLNPPPPNRLAEAPFLRGVADAPAPGLDPRRRRDARHVARGVRRRHRRTRRLISRRAASGRRA